MLGGREMTRIQFVLAFVMARAMRNVLATALTAASFAMSAGAAFGQAHLPLTEFSGVFPDGQRWQITVPANWNGTVVNDLDRIGSTSRANVLLPRGYAYTGTQRHPDRGTHWDPRAESNNMVKVLDEFEARVGRPARTIQFGCSGGGSVAMSVAEDHPTRFDGVIPMHGSSPVTIANQRLDLTFALKVLLDTSNQLQLIVGDAETAAAEKVWLTVLASAQQTPEGRARMALAGVLAQYPAWGSNANPPSPMADPKDPAAVQQALLRVVVDGARIAITARPQWATLRASCRGTPGSTTVSSTITRIRTISRSFATCTSWPACILSEISRRIWIASTLRRGSRGPTRR